MLDIMRKSKAVVFDGFLGIDLSRHAVPSCSKDVGSIGRTSAKFLHIHDAVDFHQFALQQSLLAAASTKIMLMHKSPKHSDRTVAQVQQRVQTIKISKKPQFQKTTNRTNDLRDNNTKTSNFKSLIVLVKTEWFWRLNTYIIIPTPQQKTQQLMVIKISTTPETRIEGEGDRNFNNDKICNPARH